MFQSYDSNSIICDDTVKNMAGPITPACTTQDCVLLNKIFSYILLPGQGLTLPTAQNVIRNIYYDLTTVKDANNYFLANPPVPPFPDSKTNWGLGDATRAVALIEKMTNYYKVQKDDAGYQSLIETVYTICGKWYLAGASCSQGDLNLSPEDYARLWERKYCRVNLGSTLNYKVIGDYAKWADDPVRQTAAQNVLQGFKAAETLIDPDGMEQDCQATMSYNSMKDPNLSNLCGCYMTLPIEQYTSEEVATMKDNPACLPSCLAAYIKRFEGGQQQNCNQNTCIIDNVVISGGTASISNDCPLCYKTKNCVCYIHVNNTIISGEEACQSTTEVGSNGNVTAYTVRDDSGQSAAINIIVIVVIAIVLFAAGIVYMIYELFRQYRAGRSTAPPKRKPNNSILQEPKGRISMKPIANKS